MVLANDPKAPPAALLASARQQGQLALVLTRESEVFEEVAHGHPLIVRLKRGWGWWSHWQYSVLVGYDRAKQKVFLLSENGQNEEMTMEDFGSAWEQAHGWALLVLPPQTLPVSQRELDVTTAAIALEQAAGPEVAETTYREILKKWPKNIGARFGLSNTRYAQNDTAGAVSELQTLVKNVPGLAPAWHNLSLLLKEQGRMKEAKVAAQKAQETASASEKEKYRQQFNKPAPKETR